MRNGTHKLNLVRCVFEILKMFLRTRLIASLFEYDRCMRLLLDV